MKKYLVMQGMMTSSGTGDYCKYGEFTNKADAIKKFNEIKNDLEGYSNKPTHGYLETTIELYENDEFVEMLKSFKVSFD